MTKINFNQKTFSLIENSDTIFKYKQEENLVTADYHGGEIKYGKIIAKLENETLHMLYQCLTDENELKAGKAIAKISLNEKNQIKLTLGWKWLCKTEEKGASKYIEN